MPSLSPGKAVELPTGPEELSTREKGTPPVGHVCVEPTAMASPGPPSSVGTELETKLKAPPSKSSEATTISADARGCIASSAAKQAASFNKRMLNESP